MKHIVILKKKYLDFILEGKKTIESRWSIHKTLPYGRVNIGDILYLKETGGDVVASARVKDVKTFTLDSNVVDYIIDTYGDAICINKDNRERYNKNYCTLIWVSDVKNIEPFKVKKSYGSGWMLME